MLLPLFVISNQTYGEAPFANAVGEGLGMRLKTKRHSVILNAFCFTHRGLKKPKMYCLDGNH